MILFSTTFIHYLRGCHFSLLQQSATPPKVRCPYVPFLLYLTVPAALCILTTYLLHSPFVPPWCLSLSYHDKIRLNPFLSSSHIPPPSFPTFPSFHSLLPLPMLPILTHTVLCIPSVPFPTALFLDSSFPYLSPLSHSTLFYSCTHPPALSRLSSLAYIINSIFCPSLNPLRFLFLTHYPFPPSIFHHLIPSSVTATTPSLIIPPTSCQTLKFTPAHHLYNSY